MDDFRVLAILRHLLNKKSQRRRRNPEDEETSSDNEAGLKGMDEINTSAIESTDTNNIEHSTVRVMHSDDITNLRLNGGTILEQVKEEIEDKYIISKLLFIQDQYEYGTISEDESRELALQEIARDLVSPISNRRFLVDFVSVVLFAAMSVSGCIYNKRLPVTTI